MLQLFSNTIYNDAQINRQHAIVNNTIVAAPTVNAQQTATRLNNFDFNTLGEFCSSCFLLRI